MLPFVASLCHCVSFLHIQFVCLKKDNENPIYTSSSSKFEMYKQEIEKKICTDAKEQEKKMIMMMSVVRCVCAKSYLSTESTTHKDTGCFSFE